MIKHTYINTIESIPEELKNLNQWAINKLNSDGNKVPYTDFNKMAKSNDSSTWLTFEDAYMELISEEEFHSVCFMVDKESEIAVIDIDGKSNKSGTIFNKQGTLLEEYAEIISEINSYTEISYSEKGIHIVGKINLERINDYFGEQCTFNNSKGFEIFLNKKPVTLTGNIYENFSDLNDITDKIIEFHQVFFKKNINNEKLINSEKTETSKLSKNKIFSLIKDSKFDIPEDFNNLYETGDFSKWVGSDNSIDWSSADYALIKILIYYTQDKEQLWDIWKESEVSKCRTRNISKTLNFNGYYFNKICMDAYNRTSKFYSTKKIKQPKNTEQSNEINETNETQQDVVEINGREIVINFIINKNGKRFVAVDEFHTFVNDNINEIVSDDFLNFERGGYRIWDEDEQYWRSFVFDDLLLKDKLQKIFRNFTSLTINKHFDSVIKQVIMPHIIRKFECNEKIISYFDKKIIPIAFMNGTLYIEFSKIRKEYKEEEMEKYTTNIKFLESFNKNDYCIFKINYDFKQELLEESFWKHGFLWDYLDNFYTEDNLLIMQHFLGTIFIPFLIVQTFLLIIGNGGDGKSELIGNINQIIRGKNLTSNINFNDIHKKFSNCPLVYSIFNRSSELNDKEIDTNFFKQLFGGKDRISIEQKGKDRIEIAPFAKHLCLANKVPKFAEIDDAVIRRISAIKCEKKKNMKQNYSTYVWENKLEKEQEKILSFILCGLISYIQEGFYTFKIIDTEIKNEIANESDTFGPFLDVLLDVNNPPVKIANDEIRKLHEMWIQTDSKYSKNVSEQKLPRKIKLMFKLKGIKEPVELTNFPQNSGKLGRGYELPLSNFYLEKLNILRNYTVNKPIETIVQIKTDPLMDAINKQNKQAAADEYLKKNGEEIW